MQKITFRKLAGEKYIYPELQGHFIEFLGSCIYDGIWVGEDSEIPNYHGIRKDLVDSMQSSLCWPNYKSRRYTFTPKTPLRFPFRCFQNRPQGGKGAMHGEFSVFRPLHVAVQPQQR